MFKPANTNKRGNGVDKTFDAATKFPIPDEGNQEARISLIVDIGMQSREDYTDPVTKEVREQRPCQQIVYYADIVDSIVDYGGSIGEQQYRICLNKVFSNEVYGVNFTATAPKDKDGKIIAGKKWSFSPASLHAKIAKATKKEVVMGSGTEDENMDVTLFLNAPLMVDITIKETVSEKKDKETGENIVYRNVNYTGLSSVPPKSLANVTKLNAPAKCITFDNAVEDDIKYLRGNVVKKIKAALNYEGSNMEKAIKAFEASKGVVSTPPADKHKASTPSKTATKKPVVDVDEDDDSDDIPF